jgi:hypothetical protein
MPNKENMSRRQFLLAGATTALAMMAARTTRFATASEGSVDEYTPHVGYSERSLGFLSSSNSHLQFQRSGSNHGERDRAIDCAFA